jgi:hypothetical protein
MIFVVCVNRALDIYGRATRGVAFADNNALCKISNKNAWPKALTACNFVAGI